jgi:hypothetical protein
MRRSHDENDSHSRLEHIDQHGLDTFLREAGVEPLHSSAATATSLTHLVDDALKLNGLTPEELKDIDEAFSAKQASLNLSADIGIGLAVLGIAQSGEIMDVFIKAGGRLGHIIINNIDTLFTDNTIHLLQDGIKELVFDLPGGTIHLGEQLFHLCTHPAEIVEAVNITIEHGLNIFDALEVVGMGADIAELTDAATTFGATLVLSWGVRKYVDSKYKPLLEEKDARLMTQKSKYIELEKLRRAMKSRLPARIVAIQLGSVDRLHWGF